MLKQFLPQTDINQLIIFTATREDAARLALLCEQLGHSAVGLSGKLSQSSRNAVMQAFATGKHQVLVTTDLASRGLDLLQVSHVINFDLPKHAEEYVHRIGRTGRFGRKGTAINLIGDQKSIEVLAAIEAHFSAGGKEMISMAECDPEALADTIDIL